MLFKPVYGPELESIFLYVNQFGPVHDEKLYNIFGSFNQDIHSKHTTIKDTLIFLESAGLIQKEDQLWKGVLSLQSVSHFKTVLLKQLRQIQFHLEPKTPLDPYFFSMLEILFIQPDLLFRSNLHMEMNQLNLPQSCSKEKVNGWKRVLEYLGIGLRGYNGFLVLYDPDLVLMILNEWSKKEGTLQSFLEGHFNNYLPWCNSTGEIAQALADSLRFLKEQGKIRLLSKQDLPSKSYFYNHKYKWIIREEVL